LESLVTPQFWQGKKVFITGHTGFKGVWLSLWLLQLGAKVAGLSLAPNTEPSLFEQLALSNDLKHHIGDIRDLNLVKNLIQDFQPDIVFHLAAQPLADYPIVNLSPHGKLTSSVQLMSWKVSKPLISLVSVS
jgi:CDP-glucose 4,6-dehydratase